MSNVYIISPSFIRTMSQASDNLQDKFLQSAIREAQDINLQGILGSCLYNRCLELVETNDIAKLEYDAYKEMLDVAQYYLLYTVLANVIVSTTFKINNIGLNQTSDENVRVASIGEMFKLKDYYVNKADFYCKRLQEYVYENKKAFKELDECTCSKMKANLYSAASTSVWLGGMRGRTITSKTKEEKVY